MVTLGLLPIWSPRTAKRHPKNQSESNRDRSEVQGLNPHCALSSAFDDGQRLLQRTLLVADLERCHHLTTLQVEGCQHGHSLGRMHPCMDSDVEVEDVVGALTPVVGGVAGFP